MKFPVEIIRIYKYIIINEVEVGHPDLIVSELQLYLIQ